MAVIEVKGGIVWRAEGGMNKRMSRYPKQSQCAWFGE